MPNPSVSRELVERTIEVLGTPHQAEEGPNAGWRGVREPPDLWYDDDLRCRADCPVCAVQRDLQAVLDA